MSKHFRELSDDDIRQMARDAEALNERLDVPVRKPRGWHYRHAAILLGLVPVSEMTLEEMVWHLREALAKAT